MIGLTRPAARLVLDHFRTAWSMDNRRTFMQLAGIDIARWWAFRGSEQFLTADWGFEATLARHGLASLALTPSPVDMIGQVPPLHEQGLKLVTEPVEQLRDDKAFDRFAANTRRIRDGYVSNDYGPFYHQSGTPWTVFPHEIDRLPNVSAHGWRLRWCQGFGPFAWRADIVEGASVEVDISGPCAFLVSGGPDGGDVMVEDLASGYAMTPMLSSDSKGGQVMNLIIPGNVTHRTVRLTAMDAGITFHGLAVHEPQPYDPDFHFDWHCLPPA